MAIMMVLESNGGTVQQYDLAIKELFGLPLTSSTLPKGLLSHVCVKTYNGIKIIDIWSTNEDFDAFGVKLMPALDHAHIPKSEIILYEVHNFLKP